MLDTLSLHFDWPLPRAMSAKEFWAEGCTITNHNVDRYNRAGLRLFRGNFGTTPAICSVIWTRLCNADAHPAGTKPIHLLYALFLLRTYGTEAVLKSQTGRDEKTFHKWAWAYIELLADLDVVRMWLVLPNVLTNVQ